MPRIGGMAMGDRQTADAVAAWLRPFGLLLRGGFVPGDGDGVPAGVRAVLMIGNAGSELWQPFREAAESQDGLADPMDRWTETVVGPIARAVGAVAAYPFGGPPFHPFQRWAQRADAVFPSPVGMLVHPAFGLWHAWRAALLFDRPIVLPPRDSRPSPCATCRDRPCLGGCPVGAFSQNGYDVPACAAHLRGGAGSDCLDRGCLARHACPVGRPYAYAPEHARFHMGAFERNRPAS